ncbi:MAG: 2-phospho-L-lactate guanylyltransferase [Anaerolineae bacterium]|nr:2-phospho-L-lactate guanylyltransferase [Anaerolineae bacterium]
MRVWAVLPVKPFVRAKSRLATILPAEQREMLAEKMFRHGLEVLTSTRQIAGVLVVSRDTKALSMAREYGVNTVQESGAPELNVALLRAAEYVRRFGAEGVLVVPSDLPMYTSADIEQVLHLGRYHMTVVIAPDRTDNGTNALLVTPPGLIPYSFGPGSFRRHIELAEQAGATVKILRSERLGLDVDTPADLELYNQLTGAPASVGIAPAASARFSLAD